jgi:hypothetical protein
METTVKKVTEKRNISRSKETLSAKERIKPRGIAGCMKGKIHYDRNADIFNLAPL